jgi:hypothetical protein
VGVQQGLSAQRIWQDLCEQVAYPTATPRCGGRLKRRHPRLVEVLEHPPGEEAQVDFFQRRLTRPRAGGGGSGIFRLTLSCSKHG